MTQLGKTIKMLRINAGIKQKNLAEKVGISSNYLSLVENGKREPSIPVIQCIAEELDIPISYIFWYAYEKPTNLPEDQERLFDSLKALLFQPCPKT